jgi:hypothetical protein
MEQGVAVARVKTVYATKIHIAAATFGTKPVQPSAMKIATDAALPLRGESRPQEMAALRPTNRDVEDANVKIASAPLIPIVAKPPGMRPVFKNAQMTVVDALETPEEKLEPLTAAKP